MSRRSPAKHGCAEGALLTGSCRRPAVSAVSFGRDRSDTVCRARADCMDGVGHARDAHRMRHGHHTRRSAPDPLAPIDAPTWLVVRDMCGQLRERTELVPRADQRAILAAAREARIADGWLADEVGPRCSQFFAARGGERVMVGIERDPGRQIRR